jgi:RimJ/RimL family protein N-acetyltransferase
VKNGIGLCLVHQQEVLCEAFAGPVADGQIEITTHTHISHRRQGYATFTCHHLINELERHGYHTYGCCSKENDASVALARKLGYQSEREYRLVTWPKIDA